MMLGGGIIGPARDRATTAKHRWQAVDPRDLEFGILVRSPMAQVTGTLRSRETSDVSDLMFGYSLELSAMVAFLGNYRSRATRIAFTSNPALTLFS